jgi:hypothetical protein
MLCDNSLLNNSQETDMTSSFVRRISKPRDLLEERGQSDDLHSLNFTTSFFLNKEQLGASVCEAEYPLSEHSVMSAQVRVLLVCVLDRLTRQEVTELPVAGTNTDRALLFSRTLGLVRHGA